ncbi:MAG: chorismate--pyruvate lyase family protein [Formosimonas sp.]
MTALHSPWQTAVPRIHPRHRHWLTGQGSLTAKLKAHSQHFAVVRIMQAHSALQQSETHPLHLPHQHRVVQRQVLLLCDEQPVVFAHTVTDAHRVSRDWPFFNALGNRALGVMLFADPLIHRVRFEYTRLAARDELYQAATRALRQAGFAGDLPAHLWARRCVFSHRRRPMSRMMVTEVMLPAVYALKPRNRPVF